MTESPAPLPRRPTGVAFWLTVTLFVTLLAAAVYAAGASSSEGQLPDEPAPATIAR